MQREEPKISNERKHSMLSEQRAVRPALGTKRQNERTEECRDRTVNATSGRMKEEKGMAKRYSKRVLLSEA